MNEKKLIGLNFANDWSSIHTLFMKKTVMLYKVRVLQCDLISIKQVKTFHILVSAPCGGSHNELSDAEQQDKTKSRCYLMYFKRLPCNSILKKWR